MDAITPNKTLVDQAYDALLDAICTGEIKPGERLNLDALAARCNVSRQPVDRAVAMLKAQRLVQDADQRGIVVARIDDELFDSIYQFRMAVEPMAVRLATTRMSEAAISLGQDIIARGKRHVENGDRAAALQADIDFHNLIYELSGNRVIADAMSLNWRHLQRSMSEVLSAPGATLRIWNEHDQIFAAMAQGEAGEAAALMRAHMENAAPRAVGFERRQS